MLSTYKAMLNGDRLEWSDEAPELVVDGQPVPVHVTILDESLLQSQRHAGGQHMAAALERLATRGGLANMPDPVTWQREIRQDRNLPGQDS
ncbi:MAG: hypothetical protein CYG59_08525 [Chloroflexi bacterium]|nr:MAG: hypothetical protein CYG59_08525 [Chloroflexota bacterium]